MKNCTSCGAPLKDSSKVCPYCNTACEIGSPEDIAASEAKAKQYPMKWHKFLLVLLIIGAVVNILVGISIIAGEKIITSHGLTDGEGYYSKYPGLKDCYRFVAVTSIAIGIFMLTVCKRLKEYRENGPISFKILIVLMIILGIIYLSWASTAMNTNLFTFRNSIAIIGYAVALIIISAYYARRSELFVN